MQEAVAIAPSPVPVAPAGVTVRVRPADVAAARSLARETGTAPATAQILLQRGLTDPTAARTFLAPRLAELTRPDAMADRGVAAERLARAVRAKERVCIFGDYDVDGTTSAAIVADGLELLGGEVVALVASRFAGGYGLSDPALDRVIATGATLLVTCDCGSSDHERLARARHAGLDVIVVDHHLVPREALPALAFLNPHRPDCGFAFKHLTSAGLAFHLLAAVRTALGATLDLRPFLDLVALGTIADVADLSGDNRTLVRAGLALLTRAAAGEGRPGLVALAELARLRGNVSAVDVAFRLGPRLNAAGRLRDPALTLALLRARTTHDAKAHALAIDAMNVERKKVEAAVTRAAIAQVEEIYGTSPRGGVVAAGEGWHRGVVGITAARLVDRFGVPVIVVGFDDGEVGHGSGRAPAGFPLYDAIARAADTLEGFGGHQAAAGVRLRASRLEALRAGFDTATRALAGDTRTHLGAHVADVALDGDAWRAPPASDLDSLEPVGAGNPEPLALVRDARVERAEIVAEQHLRLTLRVGADALDAFGWDLAARLPDVGRIATVLGALRTDPWRGPRAVGLRITAIDPVVV